MKNFPWIVGLIPFFASCASQPVPLATVGPAPSVLPSPQAGAGHLIVFTEPREFIEDDVQFFPHSGYEIYGADGKLFQFVWNHYTRQDEHPTLVTLPAGQYLVRADAELCGRVSVPVVIKPGKTTRLVLEPGWKPAAPATSTELVSSPSGYFIGWRAEAIEPEPRTR
jgi:hypothetical protein